MRVDARCNASAVPTPSHCSVLILFPESSVRTLSGRVRADARRGFRRYTTQANTRAKPEGDEYMCGIVGAIANRDVVPVLIEGLKRLEYRGYDSAGIAIVGDKDVRRVRRTGRVAEMEGAAASGYGRCRGRR